MTTKLGVRKIFSSIGLLLIGTMSAQAGILVDYDDRTMTNREIKAPLAIWHIASLEADAINRLRIDGYRRIKVTAGPRQTKRVVACRDNRREHLVVSQSGNIRKVSNLGSCLKNRYDTLTTASNAKKPKSKIAARAPRANLAANFGKTIVSTQTQCIQGQLIRVDLNGFGKSIGKKRVGVCSYFSKNDEHKTLLTTASTNSRAPKFNPHQQTIAATMMMKLSGYEMVNVLGATPKGTAIEACKAGALNYIKLDPNGAILRQSNIGRCNADNKGTAQKLKTVKSVELCTDRKLMSLDIASNGKVLRTNRIGHCGGKFDQITTAAIPGVSAPRLTPRHALAPHRKMLRAKGYNRIEFTNRSAPSFAATACHGEKKMRINMHASGFITQVSRIDGSCSIAKPLPEADAMPIAAVRTKPRHQVKAKPLAKTSSTEIKNLRNTMMMSGYSNIAIKSKGKNAFTADACRKEMRMRLDADRQGNVIRTSRIGYCAKLRIDELTTAGIPMSNVAHQTPHKFLKPMRNLLRSKGFERIRFTDRTAPLYKATVCQGDMQMRIELRSSGYINRVSRIGDCSHAKPQPTLDMMTTAAVRPTAPVSKTVSNLEKPKHASAILKARNTIMMAGYSNIAIKAAGQKAFTADACRKEKRMRLNINQNGDIIRTSRIGYCAKLRHDDITTAGIPMANVAHQTPHKFLKPMRNLLRSKGFERIRFTDRTAPFYKATVCQGEKQMRVKLRTSGYINRVSRIGDCSQAKPQPASDMMLTAAIAPALTKSAKQRASAILKAKSTLAMAGYTNIIVKAAGKKTFTANACRQAKQMRMDIDTNGDIVRTSRIGHCVKQNDILTTAALPGAKDTPQTPKQVLAPLRKMLRAKGYNRMTFTDRTTPYYQVTACIGDKQMRIDMRDSGYIFKTSRIGTCAMVRPKPEKSKPATVVETPKQTERFRVANLTTTMSDATPLPMPKPTMASGCSGLVKNQLQKEIVFFRAGGTRISSETRKQLNFVADMIKGCNSKKVIIGGYTDTDGNSHLNRKIGHGRAKTVMQYLMKRGVSRKQLSPVSFGATNPIAPNTTADNKAKNRRVQFWVF